MSGEAIWLIGSAVFLLICIYVGTHAEDGEGTDPHFLLGSMMLIVMWPMVLMLGAVILAFKGLVWAIRRLP